MKKLVFYGTNSRMASPENTTIVYPSRSEDWDNLASKYPDYEIYLVTQEAGRYLIDLVDAKLSKEPEKVKFIIMDPKDQVDEFVDKISSLNPDVVVALPSPTTPLDWNPIRDALIAEELKKKGIRTICHTSQSALDFFDKWRTVINMRYHGFPIADSRYVHNDLFNIKAEGHVVNPYREYVIDSVKKLHYPVIIKGTTGAGSIGITVVDTPEEAVKIITDPSNNEDVLVEEFMKGEQFGTEIHGMPGHYSVLPPFYLSSNESGITDPLRSVKYGPVTDEKYHIKELQKELIRLAEVFKLEGSAQVDLVFCNDKWKIIEVNPRWSGMTTLSAAAEGHSALEVYMDCVTGDGKDYSDISNLKYCFNFKIPETSREELEKVYADEHADFVTQYILQHPQTGRFCYSEVIMGGFDSKEEMAEYALTLSSKYPFAVSKDLAQQIHSTIIGG